MTEKEKMLSGKLYRTSDKELVRQRDIARNVSARYNQTTEEQRQERQLLLKGMLGALGEGVEIFPAVQFDGTFGWITMESGI